MALFGRGDKPAQSDRPMLAVDIDGVISLFGFERPAELHQVDPRQAPGEYHLIDGVLHCISMPTGAQLNRLAQTYDLVWASGWEDRANDYLPGILGVPNLPYLQFDGRAQFGTAHWKLDAIGAYAGDRALAWVDDSLDRSCYEWAEKRESPTLLVPTESSVGLTESQVGALEAWVRDGFTP
jgi:hypothetical protein